MMSFSDTPFVVPEVQRPPVELDAEGVWVYAGTEIPAVGARALTLSESVSPLLVSPPGEQPVAVLLPLAVVENDSRLEWVRRAGSKLEGDSESLIQIPWALWQEHAEEAVGAWLPERDAEGIDRSLAIAERELRFAKQAAEMATFVRNCLVVIATRVGRSRRYVAEMSGLSLGRVQQLKEDPPPDVIRFVRIAGLVAGLIGEKPCPREDVPRPRDLDKWELHQVLDAMLILGLLEEAADGLRLSKDGFALRDAPDRAGNGGKARGKSADRERAGDAAQ